MCSEIPLSSSWQAWLCLWPWPPREQVELGAIWGFFWEQIILPVFEFDLSLTQINEQLSPRYTTSMNWCLLFTGIDVQERTNCPEADVSGLSEEPELHSPESRNLRAGYRRDRPEVTARFWWDPCLCMCLRGWDLTRQQVRVRSDHFFCSPLCQWGSSVTCYQ